MLRQAVAASGRRNLNLKLEIQVSAFRDSQAPLGIHSIKFPWAAAPGCRMPRMATTMRRLAAVTGGPAPPMPACGVMLSVNLNVDHPRPGESGGRP